MPANQQCADDAEQAIIRTESGPELRIYPRTDVALWD